MKEIFRQLVTIWNASPPLQKIASVAVLVAVSCALCFACFRNSGATYAPLYPGKALTSSESNEIRTYLNRLSIPFQEDKEKRLLVTSEQVDQIRCDLFEMGIPKHETGKGFELFDTNTWIKGEKELQVLEMRALKGQLERDLSAFEHIKSASVILDIPPQRSFNTSKYSTKASVILTLMPGARLSSSELRAITNHLSGAVRGLEPHMIAISDTTGKLYKAIDPNAADDPFNDAGRLVEESLEGKISELLTCLVGEEHFHATVQAVLGKEKNEVLSLSIAVVIDKGILEGPSGHFQKEIERQLRTFAKGYGLNVDPVVDFIPFEKGKVSRAPTEKSGTLGFILTLFFVFAVLASLIPLLKRYKRRKEGTEESLFRVMTRIDVNKLADSIQREDPQTIAMMLSYLEPARAEQMIAALNPELQEAVLFHLSEFEKEPR